MRRHRVLLLLLAFLTLPACRGGSRSELVEAELRQREREVRDLREEVDRQQFYAEALQRELHDYRCAAAGQPLAEIRSADLAIRTVTIGRGSGGYDEDRCAGDEGIQVMVVPQDVDGSAVKVPGNLRVSALEITASGVKVPIGDWEVPALALRKTWQSGLLSSGYQVKLPWKKMPTTNKLRIVIQFTTSDGKLFEAEKDVTIRQPAPVPERKPTDGPIMPFPPQTEILPAPVPTDGPVLIPTQIHSQKPPIATSRPVELLPPLPLAPR